jgi:hypothetical protein
MRRLFALPQDSTQPLPLRTRSSRPTIWSKSGSPMSPRVLGQAVVSLQSNGLTYGVSEVSQDFSCACSAKLPEQDTNRHHHERPRECGLRQPLRFPMFGDSLHAKVRRLCNLVIRLWFCHLGFIVVLRGARDFFLLFFGPPSPVGAKPCSLTRTFARQASRDSETDACGGARHERPLVLKFQIQFTTP